VHIGQSPLGIIPEGAFSCRTAAERGPVDLQAGQEGAAGVPGVPSGMTRRPERWVRRVLPELPAAFWSPVCWARRMRSDLPQLIALSVTDDGGAGTAPKVERQDQEAERGRGLGMVNAIAHRSVVHESDGGHTVTAELFTGTNAGGDLW